MTKTRKQMILDVAKKIYTLKKRMRTNTLKHRKKGHKLLSPNIIKLLKSQQKYKLEICVN